MFAAPAGVMAAHQFTDVPDSSAFHGDIAWLADAGVTMGCNPPANDEFCPDDSVKRQQMAAFLRRFAAYLGAEDGIVSEPTMRRRQAAPTTQQPWAEHPRRTSTRAAKSTRV